MCLRLRSRLLLLLHASLAALLLMACALASAHGLRLAVQAEADGLRGQARYADGTPARQESVALFAGDAAKPLADTRSDAQGRFRLPLTAAGTYRVVVEGDEGHRAEASVVWAPLPGAAAAAAAAVDAATLAAAVRAEVAPLREDLARLESRMRLADLIGGIGILFGLAGSWAWWRARAGR